MARTNCINCGAAIDIDTEKCPFCGTSYYDLTSIDFDSREPVALKFRYNGMIFSCLSIPSLKEICFNSISQDVYSGKDCVCSFERSRETSIGIEFSAIMKNNVLYTIEKEIQIR